MDLADIAKNKVDARMKEVMIEGSQRPFETLVSQWLRMQGYIVQSPINYRRLGGKTVKGKFWSDIDVIATKEDEVAIVECQEWFTERIGNTIKKFEIKFRNAESFVRRIGLLKRKKARFIIASMQWRNLVDDRLKDLNRKIGKKIEYIVFSDIIKDLVNLMGPYLDDIHVGKFDEPIAWLLSRLISFEFVAIRCPNCRTYVLRDETCSSCGKKLEV